MNRVRMSRIRIAFTARVPDAAYEEEDDKKREPRRFTRLLFKLDNVGWTGDRRRHVFVEPLCILEGLVERVVDQVLGLGAEGERLRLRRPPR